MVVALNCKVKGYTGGSQLMRREYSQSHRTEPSSGTEALPVARGTANSEQSYGRRSGKVESIQFNCTSFTSPKIIYLQVPSALAGSDSVPSIAPKTHSKVPLECNHNTSPGHARSVYALPAVLATTPESPLLPRSSQGTAFADSGTVQTQPERSMNSTGSSSPFAS